MKFVLVVYRPWSGPAYVVDVLTASEYNDEGVSTAEHILATQQFTAATWEAAMLILAGASLALSAMKGVIY